MHGKLAVLLNSCRSVVGAKYEPLLDTFKYPVELIRIRSVLAEDHAGVLVVARNIPLAGTVDPVGINEAPVTDPEVDTLPDPSATTAVPVDAGSVSV
jgi:hypothetical protein